MGWIGPAQCIEQCCGPPTPCDLPVVTCRKYDESAYTTARFAYTVEGATTAKIQATCSGSGGDSGVTFTPIVLTDGAASGEVYTSPSCTYCVIATNSCGTVFCCDVCDLPLCGLTRIALQPDGNLQVDWYYSSSEPVVSATLDGDDVLGDEFSGSGTKYYAKADIPDVIELIIRNDCGREKTCSYDSPCCWNKQSTRVSISGMADINWSCEITVPVTYSPIGFFYYQTDYLLHTYSLSGLTALNGTHLFDLESSDCSVGDDLLIGTGTLTEYFHYEGLAARFASGDLTPIDVEIHREFDCVVSIYLSPVGYIYFQYPSTGFHNTGYTKYNGVHNHFPPIVYSPFDRMSCPWRCIPASNPPCPVCRPKINDIPPSNCASATSSDMVSYLWPEEVDLAFLGCPVPGFISNGTIEVEYLD